MFLFGWLWCGCVGVWWWVGVVLVGVCVCVGGCVWVCGWVGVGVGVGGWGMRAENNIWFQSPISGIILEGTKKREDAHLRAVL